jgi:hypothetical protein
MTGPASCFAAYFFLSQVVAKMSETRTDLVPVAAVSGSASATLCPS